MNGLVIAISGRSGSGKSTIRRIIEAHVKDNLSYRMSVKCYHVSIASPIREIASSLFAWDGDKTAYLTGKDTLDPNRGRGLLISIGMLMRTVWPDVWINHALRRIRGFIWQSMTLAGQLGEQAPFEIFVIDDLRFPNEAAALREE